VGQRAGEPAPRGATTAWSRDLEVICLAVPEKEPRRRYELGRGAGQDLERWLAAAIERRE
jgi:hypothetical protein